MTLDDAILIALHANKTGDISAASLHTLTRQAAQLLKAWDGHSEPTRHQVVQALARGEGAGRWRKLTAGGKGPKGAACWQLLAPCPLEFEPPGAFQYRNANGKLMAWALGAPEIEVPRAQHIWLLFSGQHAAVGIWLKAAGLDTVAAEEAR